MFTVNSDGTTERAQRTYAPRVAIPSNLYIEGYEVVELPVRFSAAEAVEEILWFMQSYPLNAWSSFCPSIVRSDGRVKMLTGKEHPAYKEEVLYENA